ncbi:MAG: pilus assembly protein PilM, partial [Nitrospira sp.]
VDAFAIENMYGINYPILADEIVALVNIGASVMTVNIMKGGTSMFTRDISLGGNRYNEALQRQLLLTHEQAERAKRGEFEEEMDKEGVSTVVDDINAEVASEIARSIDYLKTTAVEGDIQKIALCGGCGKVTGLTDRLHERMGVEVELVNPFNQIDTASCDLDPEQLADLAPEAAVGVGLAFRTIGDR